MASRPIAIALTTLLMSVGLAGCLGGEGTDADPTADPSPGIRLTCPEPCDRTLTDAPGLYASEPDIIVNPEDPDHLVAVYHDLTTGPTFWRLHTVVTFDGGETWTDHLLPLGIEPGADAFLAEYTNSGDGSVAFLPDGTVLLTANAWKGVANNHVLFSARSEDGGRTWGEFVAIHENPGALFGYTDAADKPRVATGPEGQALLVFDRTQENDPSEPGTVGERWHRITMVYSEDGGRSWSAPQPLEDTDPTPPSAVAQPGIAADGTLYVGAPRYDAEGVFRMAVMRSQDAGATWETAWLEGVSSYDYLGSLDVSGDEVHVAYALWPGDGEGCGEGGTSWTVYQVSGDAGVTWSDPLALDEPAPCDTDRQPAVRAGQGGAYVTWYQPADGEGSRPYTLEAAHVTAGGSVEQLRLSHAPIETVGGQWMGLAALPDGAYAVWEAGPATDTQIHGARMVWEERAGSVDRTWTADGEEGNGDALVENSGLIPFEVDGPGYGAYATAPDITYTPAPLPGADADDDTNDQERPT